MEGSLASYLHERSYPEGFGSQTSIAKALRFRCVQSAGPGTGKFQARVPATGSGKKNAWMPAGQLTFELYVNRLELINKRPATARLQAWLL